MKVTWPERAKESLRRVRDRMAEWSEPGADRFAAEVIERSALLGLFPERGRVVQEFGERSLRELVIRDYRLLYFVGVDEVEILGLIHGAMDLRSDPGVASDN